MLRKRYYILFVSRDEDGRVRKIPLPLQYAYGFVAAALMGAFTIVGLAGSYTRMLLKTESFNQLRQDDENLAKTISRWRRLRMIAMCRWPHWRSGQRGDRALRAQAKQAGSAKPAASAALQLRPRRQACHMTDDVNQQQVTHSIDQFYALRTEALSGQVSRALEGGLTPGFAGDWTELADAPSIWPLEGRVGSSFGEREDPINGEGTFHSGIDIEAPYRNAGARNGRRRCKRRLMGAGYGREIVLDHGHDFVTVYGHLSAIAVCPVSMFPRTGDRLCRPSGRATGPHLHYEVRITTFP